jgi:hypothetical protein
MLYYVILYNPMPATFSEFKRSFRYSCAIVPTEDLILAKGCIDGVRGNYRSKFSIIKLGISMYVITDYNIPGVWRRRVAGADYDCGLSAFLETIIFNSIKIRVNHPECHKIIPVIIQGVTPGR